MADGSTEPIEQIVEGDLVMSRSQTASVTGAIEGKRVLRAYHLRVGNTLLLTLSSGTDMLVFTTLADSRRSGRRVERSSSNAHWSLIMSTVMANPDIQRIQPIIGSLANKTITRISFDQWSVTVVFNDTEILIEGDWILTSDDSKVVDRKIDLPSRAVFELWRMVGTAVDSAHIAPESPYNLLVRGANGLILTIFADNDGYEDWTLGSPSAMVICNDTILTVFDFTSV